MQISHWKSYCKWAWLKTTGLLSDCRESLFGSMHLHQLLRRKQKSDTVLIVEFHTWHGETLPGYVKYFQDLGYRVAVVTRLPLLREKPFCRMAEKPECFYMSVRMMRTLLRSPKPSEYAYCLVTSDPLWFGYWERVADYVGKLPEGRKGGGVIIHDWEDSPVNPPPKNPEWTAEQFASRAFALTPTVFHGMKIPMLNPHFFGKNSRNYPQKHKIMTFIIVGSIKKSKRNFSELFSALAGLQGEWTLKIVGSVEDPSCLPQKSNRIEIFGRLNFPDLYNALERSNFLLPLLDPECVEHQHYLHSCTSGSRQLCLGFSVIPVIHRAFGEHYGFTDGNAILYEKDGLSGAMQRAIDMKNEEYQSLVHGLQQEQQRVYAESLENLKQRLNRS